MYVQESAADKKVLKRRQEVLSLQCMHDQF